MREHMITYEKAAALAGALFGAGTVTGLEIASPAPAGALIASYAFAVAGGGAWFTLLARIGLDLYRLAARKRRKG